ncbi:MAG: DEAD/DEAH box helicase [Salinibacterium sp.]|nr:DEAD/DEAH box helicase [Salinibacterium sp.]
MLRALREELRRCTSFTFSVAFVSPRAIALLKQEFIEFEGVGRIITSDYLGFNSPQAFAELLNLKHLDIDVRLYEETAFHPKGYVFQRPEGVTAILGSSNLTENALVRNHEWNLRVSVKRDSDLSDQFSNLIDTELARSAPLTQDWIDSYAIDYRPPAARRRPPVNPPGPEPVFSNERISPNSMQVEALAAIEEVRAAGNTRALVVSATGTGKTILSALDVRAVDPARVLFIAHREQILDRAMREYQRVLDAPPEDFGKLAGATRQRDRRYVFATVQTLSQAHVLEEIDPNEFDYILIDEVHRAGAVSYAHVINHFRPRFLLGMTATPERTDGLNIFELFEYNVPYEIRLNSALELDMLAPFHYYGVTDFTFDDGVTTDDTSSLVRLVAPERVDHILRAIDMYGHAGVAPRGLIFCSRKDEARELAYELNRRTYRGQRLRTVALTGEDSIEYRERTVEQLEAGEVDYILSVDIFNEGVDIPSINQVVMLRQTQSSIVFVQQLGRGLRKAPGKDYLVVIDFIGNYTNNYLIPIALFGDESLNKESLRKNLIAAEESGVLAGLSSVRFDRIAQQRVLRSLAEAKLDNLHSLKRAIESTRNRVGRLPALADFLRFESADPIVVATKLGNYPRLLEKLFHEKTGLSAYETAVLTVASKEWLTAKRPHELLLLRKLLSGDLSSVDIESVLLGSGVVPSAVEVTSAIRALTLEFNTATERSNYGVDAPATTSAHGGLALSDQFVRSYAESPPFRRAIDDLIATGLSAIENRYRFDLQFTPGRQYSRKDSSRLLGWATNMYSTIYGYRVDRNTSTCAIFVTLHKSGQVSASTAYEDELLDPRTLLWYTRSRRTLASQEVRAIVDNDVALHVFAKKNDAEGADFYYLGQATSHSAEQTTMLGDNGNELPVVRMHLQFDDPIDVALFDYFHPNLTG